MKAQHLKEGAALIPDEAIAAPVVVRVDGKDYAIKSMKYERGDKALAPEAGEQGHDQIVLEA